MGLKGTEQPEVVVQAVLRPIYLDHIRAILEGRGEVDFRRTPGVVKRWASQRVSVKTLTHKPRYDNPEGQASGFVFSVLIWRSPRSVFARYHGVLPHSSKGSPCYMLV